MRTPGVDDPGACGDDSRRGHDLQLPGNYYIPQPISSQGIKSVHPYPFCANEDSRIVGRFDSEYAWRTFPKLQLNPPHAYAAIILDVDNPSDAGWPSGTPTPVPSWLVLNTRARTPTRRAGGIHCVYALEVPVARHNAAHTLPLAYLSHVADRLAYHMGADPGYQGLITRNPLRPGEGCFTHWGRMLPYSLSELDRLLPRGKPPPRRQTDLGRNCDLFRAQVSEVFRPRWAPVLEAEGWELKWLDYVRGQNVAMFGDSFLPDSECRSIAKSCFRYWLLRYDPGRFSEIQRARMGKRWHGDFNFDFDRQAQDVRELKGWGLKQVTIAAVVGLSPGRVSQLLAQGRVKLPWY